MNEIVMPKLSDTMTEGRLVSWKKRVGESVQRGDVIAEVETDKANMELEAFTAGVLLETKAEPGDVVQVGTVIAIIGAPGEKGGAREGAAPAGAGKAEAPATGTPEQPQPELGQPQAHPGQPQAQAERPQAQPEQPKGEPKQPEPEPQPQPAPQPSMAEEQKEAAAQQGEMGGPAAVPEAKEGQPQAQPGAAPEQRLPEQPAAPPQGPAEQGAESRERAAPVVRRRARELGIELAQVKGSGPDGRILLQDLEQYQQRPAPSAGAAQPAAPQAAAKGAEPAPQKLEEGVKPLPRLRAAIAKVVSESRRSIPHFYVTMEIGMDDAESLRAQLKRAGKAVTLNDLIVKGVALALLRFPQLNAGFTAEGMRLHADVNIGVAVGVRDGVLVPVINGCDKLSLLEISQVSHRLADRARSGALTEQEMSGGTFSVSNMGMFGVNHFTAIIYPAQSGVLAVGAVVEKLVLHDGIPATRKVMKVTLSADHRLVDGAYAAEFLAELKTILESPVRLLI